MKVPSFDVLVLLLYLVPGFLAIQLYKTKYPAKRASQLEVVVWSVLHSFVILLLVAWSGRLSGADDIRLLSPNMESVLEPGVIAELLVGGLLWGIALIGFHWMRVKVPFLPSPDPLAVWPLVAGDIEKQQLWAVARTKEGSLYLGWIERYSFDPEADDHELLLCPAYLVDNELRVQRQLDVGGVYLNTRDLDSMERIPGSAEEHFPPYSDESQQAAVVPEEV